VAADHEHALDTWRWVLRLDRQAALSLQLGALFHDVERLQSEAEQRFEQRVDDYVGFKRSHAQRGSQMVAEVLGSVDAPPALIQRTQFLVARHEAQRQDRAFVDRDVALLSTADALSFFSLNAPGFLKYFGPEHTARKVAYSLARLELRAWQYLPRLKMIPPLRRLVDAAEPLGVTVTLSAS
jgi:hypothetical protein